MKQIDSNQHFNPYIHHNHLLIQFIASEFIHAHIHIHQLKPPVFQTLSSAPSDFFSQTMHHLSCLLGVPHNCRPWSSYWHRASLTKLKTYTEQLNCNNQHQSKTFLDLYRHIHRCWMNCMHYEEMLKGVPMLTPYTNRPSPVDIHTFSKIVSSLHSNIAQAAKHLLKALQQYIDNENVLLFLLKRKEELQKVYGSECLLELFCSKKSKKKVPHLELLKEKYTRRGFDNIVSIIDNQHLKTELLSI